MSTTNAVYEVELLVDGYREIRTERVPHDYVGIKQGKAEVQAIKAALARGVKDVRCTHSRWMRDEVSS